MPVDFLSAAQIAGYGRYGEPPSARQLERFFHFDDRDRELIADRRGDHNRLGFAVQLATVRFLGTFLAHPADVPPVVARTVARELAITDSGCLAAYARREQTHREHAGEIQRAYGYRDFSQRTAQGELTGWLHARAWMTAERPSVLFDLATARLIEAKVLLPGASVLARLIATARDQATDRLHATLADAPTSGQRERLRALLEVGPGEALSGLERLRAGPRKLTATELTEALVRLRDVRDIGVGQIVVDVPAGRERALARYGLVAKAQALRRMSAKRRDATLLAALWQLELDAADDSCCSTRSSISCSLKPPASTRTSASRRCPNWIVPHAGCARPCSCCSTHRPAALTRCGRRSAHASAGDELHAASEAIGRLTPPELDSGGQDAAFRAELLRRYPSVRRFLPALLEVMPFDATGAGRPVLDALDALRAIEGRPGRVSAASVPLQLVSGQWKRLVLANPQLADGELDRRAYSFCVLEALQRALDRRDVFVARSGRYSDPRAKLLSGPAWEAARPEICASLNHHPNPAHALDRLCAELDGAYRQTAGRLDTNVALEIQRIAGMDRPDLSALERLDEPAELSELRADVDALLPNRVAFSEILLEVCRWTAFADAFTHLSEGRARVKDLHISICAVLLAEACNISLHDVAHPGVPALTYARLSWVSQNYVRAETIAAANDLLLKVHAQIPLVAALGDGHIATVDGMRFRVPVRSIHAGPNPRYFDTGRGVTWLNYMSDQFAGLHAIVVPGTLRDSLITLDGLLELQPPGAGGPTMIISDQASYSDQVFGLYWLLGYQFSPRPAGLPDQRFWHFTRDSDYGALHGLARNRINTPLILAHWDDILRVLASLSTGTVRASELLRVLQGGGRPTPLGRAIAELGRAAKTLHLLHYIDSDTYRRCIGVHINRHEGRHAVARVIFHGNRGELRQPYREGQEDQLAALGFALNVLVLWNTQYMDDAVGHLRRGGREISDEHLARLSPLQHEHILMLGTFPFTLPHELADGQRRRLRTDDRSA